MVFADADEPELAREFMSFMLAGRAGVIAERNVAFPRPTRPSSPTTTPNWRRSRPNRVTFTYDEPRLGQ